MSRTLLFASLLTLMACPTPPEPNNSPTGTPNSNPGPNNGNNANNTAGNNVPTAPPPKGGEGGEGANSAPGNIPDGKPTGGPASPPSDDSQLTPPDGEEELKEPSEEDMEKDGSILGVFNDMGDKELPPKYTQSSVESLDHVTLAGTITCKGDGCDTNFVLRITPSFKPTSSDGPLSDTMKQQEGGTITSKEIQRGGGQYTILVPKSDDSVVLELLLDEDENGKASAGEKFVIYEGGGGISLSKDSMGLNFQFSPKDMKAPLGGAMPQD